MLTMHKFNISSLNENVKHIEKLTSDSIKTLHNNIDSNENYFIWFRMRRTKCV